jgi:hypothetical protein
MHSFLALLMAAAGCGDDAVTARDAGRDAGSTDAGSTDAGAPGCPGVPSCPACQNGLDDDGDMLVDYPLDPGCMRREDTDEGEPPPPAACANDLDDDEDGSTDYPDDPGCTDEEDDDETDPPPPACENDDDDDGDGDTDYPDDPGCSSARDTDETDGCPGACPACANGVDDDGDGDTDHPADAECASASDDDERCAIVGSFDEEWPGPWVDESGFPPFMSSRRAIAAHDGPFGLLNSIMTIMDPSVTTGAPGESASVWVRTTGDSNTIHQLHFGIGGTGSHACFLSIDDVLSFYDVPRAADPMLLESTPVTIEVRTWYRLEVAFMEGGVVECRVYGDGTTPLATISHTFTGSLESPIGIRGMPLAAFDTVEVCR